jgi:hypothetical protein
MRWFRAGRLASPGCSGTAQETYNTLRYASRAKRIQNKPVIRMDPQQQIIQVRG